MVRKNNQTEPRDGESPWWLSGTAVTRFMLLVALLVVWQSLIESFSLRTIPYSEFKSHLQRGEVRSVTVDEFQIEGELLLRSAEATGTPSEKEKPIFFKTIRVEDAALVHDLQEAQVSYAGKRPSFFMEFLWGWIIPISLMWLLWSWMTKNIGATAKGLMSFGRSRTHIVEDTDVHVSFEDVAGCDEAKYELQEVVDFLKHPDRYSSLGAKIPKGVLLLGPPGTGKTLLARAVAGEAQVPFFSISGSDFVEMFVGVGAARVRDLFEQAKAQAPCIIFLDEIDAIGRHRGIHQGTVNDEREQTLNQLLVELDGFTPTIGVIVLAATNRPDILDAALLRPGRFDRQVILDAPDLVGREAILKIHSKGKPLAPEVQLHDIARITPGFSGADLANAMNEAALLTARRRGALITQQDLQDAVEKVVAGPERKSRRLTDEQRQQVAYHEAGHALVAYYSPNADPIHKISIIPRGRAALGFTMQFPTDEHTIIKKDALLDQLKTLLGGRAAEELIYHTVTTGAENDLERATFIAQQMVCLFGMSDALGPVHYARKQSSILLGNIVGTYGDVLQRDCSEQISQEIDKEVRRMLDASFKTAKEILTTHKDKLELVVQELLRLETIDKDQFQLLLKSSEAQAVVPKAA
jgi:cell division protease FtsH